MKVKRIRKLKVNCHEFKINWISDRHYGGDFDYLNMTINIGVKDNTDDQVFMIVCHEIMEIVALEMNVRFPRPDCGSDYIFVFDHRQHETMMNMFSSLISQFIK